MLPKERQNDPTRLVLRPSSFLAPWSRSSVADVGVSCLVHCAGANWDHGGRNHLICCVFAGFLGVSLGFFKVLLCCVVCVLFGVDIKFEEVLVL